MPEPSADPRDQSPTDGDAEASAFVGQYFPFVWRVLRRLGLEPSDADDAAQRVMLVAAERRADIRSEQVRSFLYQTAVFMASRHRRTQRRRREVPDVDLEQTSDPNADPETLLAQRRAREQLDAILERMPSDLRAAFVLFEIEGMSKDEVALALGIPAGTAASRLRRAREDFAKRAERIRRTERPRGAIA
jgi:RNA polymerase sigma-70 factor (ECF subfamily)